MDLVNQTQTSANFFNTIISDDKLMGAVVNKAVYKINRDELVPHASLRWPVHGDAIETEYGKLDGETPFLRDGVDLIVLGNAYPNDEFASAKVYIAAGDRHFNIDVIGDRVWTRSNTGNLVPSRPKPFTKIPLIWENAYGGKAKLSTGDAPFPANPNGRGYYVSEAEAEGNPLPNLENPNARITSWEDHPVPQAPAPCTMEQSLRILNSVEYDTSGIIPRLTKIKPSYYNNAHPNLILDPATVYSAPVDIRGVRPDGQGFSFTLPPQSYHVYVQLQDRRYVFPSHLESIIVDCEQAVVVLGYRCVFQYSFVPMERRAAVLYPGQSPGSAPAEYLIDWDTFEVEEEEYA